MLKFLFSTIVILSGTISIVQAQNNVVKELNSEKIFTHGELNLELEGAMVAVGGEVIDIMTIPQRYPLYKLKILRKVKTNIWLTIITNQPTNGYKIGDMIYGVGYLTSADSMDPTLSEKIDSKSLILGINMELAK